MVSWSVSATADTPELAAIAISAAGSSEPSEAVECVWRSITAPTVPQSAVGRNVRATRRSVSRAHRALVEAVVGLLLRFVAGGTETPEGGRAYVRDCLPPIKSRRKGEYKIWNVIGASSAGTVIEWYDFYIFGTLAATLAPRFYPPGNETVQLLLYLSTFAVGFVVRPFGAIFFGRIGDLVGRKYAFLVTLIIMGVDHRRGRPATELRDDRLCRTGLADPVQNRPGPGARR